MKNGVQCLKCGFNDYLEDNEFVTCSNCGLEYAVYFAKSVEIKG